MSSQLNKPFDRLVCRHIQLWTANRGLPSRENFRKNSFITSIELFFILSYIIPEIPELRTGRGEVRVSQTVFRAPEIHQPHIEPRIDQQIGY